MRPIKFRCWNKRTKKLVFPSSLTIPQLTGDFLITTLGTEIVPKKEVELMQFTGLHDKNGKEIYEGDIVNPNSNNPRKVYWEDNTLSWLCVDGAGDGDVDSLDYLKQYDLEVIGNIYENPELLGDR